MRNENSWSRKYERCVKCGGTEYPHQGHGLCYICYQREVNGVRSEYIPRLAWARYYEQCIQCGQTVYPHMARGLCSRCYREERRKKAVVKSTVIEVRE
jgi:hypothetical protein